MITVHLLSPVHVGIGLMGAHAGSASIAQSNEGVEHVSLTRRRSWQAICCDICVL